MSADGKPSRPWMEVADEASKEKDSAKLQELVRELTDALDAEQKKKPQRRVDWLS